MDWSIIFFFLFLFSLVVMVVGTKNPQIIFPNRNILRIRFFLVNLFVSFLLLSLSIAVSPSVKKETNISNSTVTSVPKPDKLGASVENTSAPKGDKSVITNVVDCDTVKTQDGKVIRLIGMDAPETSGGGECYATQSSVKLEELILNKEVELEKDVSETDRYQRLLRYLWIGETLVNETLVRDGFAKVSTYPPDVKYQTRFQEAERLAREEGRGLWGEVCTISPTPTVKPAATSIPKPKPTTSAKSSATTAPLQTNYSSPTQTPSSLGTGGSWACNCSKTCPNMSSCAEAQYQLNVCGCSARDADHDGVACDADCQ